MTRSHRPTHRTTNGEHASNPASACPDQSRVQQGLHHEDLFTVGHDQFETDTADIVLPATTQLENFDIDGSYGHLYVQVNQPAIAPLHVAKSNTDVFRLLARKMGFAPELFEVNDKALAEQSLQPNGHTKYPPPQGFVGISVERLKRKAPVRLKLPWQYAPFAEGNFGTPKADSNRCVAATRGSRRVLSRTAGSWQLHPNQMARWCWAKSVKKCRIGCPHFGAPRQ